MYVVLPIFLSVSGGFGIGSATVSPPDWGKDTFPLYLYYSYKGAFCQGEAKVVEKRQKVTERPLIFKRKSAAFLSVTRICTR